ncbi:S-layer homology domain-containing protein [Cohnella sp. OV330]|uniref:S-layer homology domain-containing protein n=1 Tax=Cohnella sp. OV330 TaxID=1855288 RepID=UPI0008F18CD2|nr:S-layer homology domain-containing protein [Cohnella sp. OV330]SFB56390.1 S-layer homology domain-containing protein [Cohnella sp. OV330]
MKNGFYKRAAGLLLFICLLGSASGLQNAIAAEGATTFDIRVNKASAEVGDSFVVTIDGVNLDRLYAYELTLELPANATFERSKTKDYLPDGLSVYHQEGHTLRYGSTKSGQAAGENGTKTLAALTLLANASGIAEIQLVSVKTLDPELRATLHTVNKKISVQVRSNSAPNEGTNNGTENSAVPRTITAADGSGQVESGRIVVSSDGPVQAPLALLQAWAKQNSAAVLELQAGKITYSLPLSELSSPGLLALLGADASQAVIKISITEASGMQKDLAKIGAADLGSKLLIDPVEFEVTAVRPDGKSVRLSSFSAYVHRSFQLEFDVDPSQTTGVYLDEATGQLLPVPTLLRVVNGNVVADLFRKGNSAYALVQTNKRFADLEGHWSQTTVETMANKLLVKGISEQSFAPNKPVTRAEFATLLMRALTLEAVAGQASFKGIQGKWYESAVQSAANAGLMNGDPDGSFRPNAQITRQELAVVLKRAAGYAGKSVERTDQNQSRAPFADQAAIAYWARADIADVAAAGIMEGDASSTFRPEAPASRAEAAAVLKRLLVYAKMFSE